MEVTQDYLRSNFDYRSDGNLIRKISAGSSKAGSVIGYTDSKGYKKTTIYKQNFSVHQLIWMYHYGSIPRQIDHEDTNPSNNRIENLRAATQSENQQNTKLRSNNTSGFKGVGFHKVTAKYAAYIRLNGKSSHIGLFSCPKEAALAYNKAAKELFGEFARLNKIESSSKIPTMT